MIEELGQKKSSKFADFCQEFVSKNFLRLRNHLNFSKNVLAVLDSHSPQAFPQIKEYILRSPRELLNKSYLTKSFVSLLSSLDDEELRMFFQKVKHMIKELISCKYGNFLVQELLQRDIPEARETIQNEILRNLSHYLGLKYTKYVIAPLVGRTSKVQYQFTKKLAKIFLSLDPSR